MVAAKEHPRLEEADSRRIMASSQLYKCRVIELFPGPILSDSMSATC